jgi:hypothetical protein
MRWILLQRGTVPILARLDETMRPNATSVIGHPTD